MDIFILFIFVYSLDLVKCFNVMTSTRQDGPVSSYIGAEKTAKLLNYIFQHREFEKKNPIFRRDEPTMMESMKLLQKNYDVGKKYNEKSIKRRSNIHVISNPEVLDEYKNQIGKHDENENIDKKRVNIHYISNPEVLDAYRNRIARRNEMEEISLDRQRAYGEEAKRDSRITMHLFKKEDELDYRKHNRAGSSSSSEGVDDDDDSESSSDDDEDDDDDEDEKARRSVLHFRVDERSSDDNTEDVTDVPLKPEEAFDIVKPFIVEIFNKLKETNDQEKDKVKESESKTDNEDFYNPKNIESSDDITNKVIKLDLIDLTTKYPVRLWTQETDSEKDNKENEKKAKHASKNQFHFLTTSDQFDIRDSWRKKEKEKQLNKENLSREKRNDHDSRSRYTNDANDWKNKKLPASKKSFFDPAHDNNWDDTGFGYSKETNWERKKGVSSGEKTKNKHDLDGIKKTEKKESKEDKKGTSNKKKNEDDWDKPKKVKDDWDKPKKDKDDWDKPIKDKEDWDKPKKVKDDWDKPKKDKNDWDSPKKDKDDWNKPKKKKDDWDKPKKDKDDWDKPKNDKDDWDKPKNDKDDWDKPKKEKDDWDKPKKKKDDWDKPKKDNDDGDKPIKDDWDSPKHKKDDWNKKDDTWNKDAKKIIPDNKVRDRGWDLVGLDNGKKSAEKPYSNLDKNKKKGPYSSWGNYESFRNTKDESAEKDIGKDDYKDDFKPKKKVEVDTFVPKFSNNFDKPKPKRYDSYERRPASSGFGGRTGIPIAGKKSVYAD